MRRPQASTIKDFLTRHPHALFLGRGDLVADAFAGDFPLELGEGQKDIRDRCPLGLSKQSEDGLLLLWWPDLP
jgi:hypothetical protein